MFDFAKNGTIPEPVMRKILSRKFAQEVGQMSTFIFHLSYFTCDMLHVIFYMPYVACPILYFISFLCHISPVTFCLSSFVFCLHSVTFIIHNLFLSFTYPISPVFISPLTHFTCPISPLFISPVPF